MPDKKKSNLITKLSRANTIISLFILLFSLALFLWILLSCWSFIILAPLLIFILFYFIKNSEIIKNQHFKIKFLIVKNKNRQQKALPAKIISKLELFILIIYFKILHYFIVIYKDPKESFEIIKEELQIKNGKVLSVAIKNNGKIETLNFEDINKRIKQGYIKDLKVIEKLLIKLFAIHKQKRRRIKIISAASLFIILSASIISGLITSLLFPAVFKSNAGTLASTAEISGSGSAAYIKLINETATATSTAAGTNHNCAVISDGTVKCWGSNEYGQLGNGTTTDSPTPVSVSGISTAIEIDIAA